MTPLGREEIVPLDSYASIRDEYRRAVIAHKRTRRVAVGPSVTLVFEDRETLRFQVQEMLWVERIEQPSRVQHELDVYNELMPGPRELSATLFIEITEPGRIRPELDRLIGLDEHVALVLGEEPEARRVPARFDAKQFEEDRISAVQYIRFALDADDAAALADPSRYAALRVAHPAYTHETELAPPVRESLVAGMEGDPPSLLPPLPERTSAAPSVLFESARVRALHPPAPALPGEILVEGREALGADAAVAPDLWAELLEAVRRATDEVIAHHGGARIAAALVPGAPPRWRIAPSRD